MPRDLTARRGPLVLVPLAALPLVVGTLLFAACSDGPAPRSAAAVDPVPWLAAPPPISLEQPEVRYRLTMRGVARPGIDDAEFTEAVGELAMVHTFEIADGYVRETLTAGAGTVQETIHGTGEHWFRMPDVEADANGLHRGWVHVDHDRDEVEEARVRFAEAFTAEIPDFGALRPGDPFAGRLVDEVVHRDDDTVLVTMIGTVAAFEVTTEELDHDVVVLPPTMFIEFPEYQAAVRAEQRG